MYDDISLAAAALAFGFVRARGSNLRSNHNRTDDVPTFR